MLHSLYISSRPLDKGRNEGLVITLDTYQWHVYLHTHTNTHTQNFEMDLIRYTRMSGHKLHSGCYVFSHRREI